MIARILLGCTAGLLAAGLVSHVEGQTIVYSPVEAAPVVAYLPPPLPAAPVTVYRTPPVYAAPTTVYRIPAVPPALITYRPVAPAPLYSPVVPAGAPVTVLAPRSYVPAYVPVRAGLFGLRRAYYPTLVPVP